MRRLLTLMILLLPFSMNTEAADVNLLIQAAEGGIAEAQYDLAVLYERGEGGVKQNAAKARQWYETAAKNGHNGAKAWVVVSMKEEKVKKEHQSETDAGPVGSRNHAAEGSGGWLGVIVQDVTQQLAESIGMKKSMGTYVDKVVPNSPASKGGVQVGDVILQFNGQEVANSSSLPVIVTSTPVGQEFEVNILRNGKPRTLVLTLDSVQGNGKDKVVIIKDVIGIGVMDVPKEVRAEMEINEGGVFVNQLNSGAAADAGIKSGDVIVMFDGVRIDSAKHFSALTSPASTTLPVLVVSRGGPHFLAVKIPDR